MGRCLHQIESRAATCKLIVKGLLYAYDERFRISIEYRVSQGLDRTLIELVRCICYTTMLSRLRGIVLRTFFDGTTTSYLALRTQPTTPTL